MKEVKIFEPAMCCATGLCGVSVDPELLRISTVLNTLKERGIVVGRFNLSNAPQEFVDNKVVNDFINQYGVDNLPVTLVDREIKVIGHYPSNAEFTEWFGLAADVLSTEKESCCCNSETDESGCCAEDSTEESNSQSCCCGGGC